MNEEELKKKIRRLSKENHTKYYDDDYGEDLEIDNDKEIERLKSILEGFQKGKLEQKKEDKNKQDEFYNEFDLASNCSKDDKLFKKLWNKYFKQLQKEIGGMK